MRKLVLLAMGIVLLCNQVLAQNRTISGKITDDKGIPVITASVMVKGTRIGTTANSAGEFTITVPNNAKALIVSAVGFAQQEVAIGNNTSLSISMKLDDKNMEEVVVTGYTREKKTQFSGAASVINTKAVETVPVGSFDQALQGRAPGLQVNSGSGQPGSNAQIWIRGVQSISGAFAQPLFVVDGVPLAAGVFQTLNPNDFESITVLKDASAAALYGSRAGTGVIVITTKKGRLGATNVQYRTQFGFTQRPTATNFDMMNSAEALGYEEKLKIVGSPGWTYGKSNPAYAALPAATKARYDFILDSLRNINTDVLGLFFRQGFSQQHELNISGGSDKTRFYLSGSMFDQEGTDLRAYLKRYTTRFNIDHTTNKLTVQLNTSVGYSRMDQSEGEWYGNSTRNTFQMAWRSKPYEYPYRANGTLNYGASTALALKQIANAIEGIENSTWRQNQIKVNGGLTVMYRLLESLTLKNTFGVDVNDDRYQRWIKPDSYIGSLQTFQKGLDIEAHRISSQIINTASLVFANRFASRHDVELGAYLETIRGYQRAMGFTLYNLDPRLPQTGQGAGALPVSGTTYPQTSSSARSGYGIRSYFATARYSLDGKYTLNASLRRDGTSIIVNPENREVTTWSLGATWNAIQENFLANASWLTDLRIRASYGAVPNIGSIPLGSYGALQSSSITGVTNYQSPQVPAYGSAAYAGSTLNGLVPTTPGNPDLRIETVHKLNLGFDLAVFNRARLSVDVYRNKTVDLFVSQILPYPSGFGSANINAGIMTNRGIELLASVDVIRNKNVDLIFTLNHAYNKNKIEDLGLVEEYVAGTFLIKKGLPYGSHYSTSYLGADPATGRPMYEKADGSVTLDPAQAANFAKFGTFMPAHTGGFNFDFRWKNFSIAAFFSYQFDVVRYNNIESWVTRGISGYASAVNQSRRVLTEQWEKPGDVKWIQSPLYDRGFTSTDLEDAKFLRFRNLNVAYNIPQIAIGNTRIIKSARFYVQMQNLAIWSPWRGPDPEDNNNISLNEYPNPKMIVTGIDINF